VKSSKARRIPTWLGLVALASVVLVGADPASAQQPLRVLLVIDRADDRFAERIRAEIAALGLEVVTLEPWRTGETIDSLEAVGKGEQAAAAIRVVPSRKGVEVWMANQPTGRSLLRQLVIDENGDAPNEGLVALQTAELLRTSLLSVPDPRRAAQAKPSPSPSAVLAPAVIVAAPSATPPRRAGVQAGVGAMFSPGGSDPTLQAWVSLQRLIGRRVGLALDLSAPLRTAELSGPEGSARMGSMLAGGAVFGRFEAPSGFYAVAAGGVAVVRVGVEGDAASPLLQDTEAVMTGAGYARLDGGFEATRWLRFGLRAVAGATASRVNVRFAGNQAGEWGWPFLAGFVITEVAW
jgi:hypothetical protein